MFLLLFKTSPWFSICSLSNSDQLTGRQAKVFEIHLCHLTAREVDTNNDLIKSCQRNEPEQPDCRRRWFEVSCGISGPPSAGGALAGAAGGCRENEVDWDYVALVEGG